MRVFGMILLALVPWMALSEASAQTGPASKGKPASKGAPASKSLVAVFSLTRPVSEAPAGDDLLFGSVGAEPLKDLVARLRKVRADSEVRAVALLLGDASLGYAQIEEIRGVLDAIKSAGKEIHVHADSLAMRDYVLASGASKISVVPTGSVVITGMRTEQPYVRGLLDLIGVKPDFMTCGDYKSAAEMFMQNGPSEEADRMSNWLLDSLFETAVGRIAGGRGVSPKKARGWIDGGLYTAETAKAAGIIDAVEFREDFVAGLKSKYGEQLAFDKRYGKKKRSEVDLSSPMAMFQVWGELLGGSRKKKPKKDAIAVVYVEGPIVPGSPQPSPFSTGSVAYSTPIRKALEQAAGDDSIKAVVLRVDSPGGSATASEIILQATRGVKAKKPLVVSMGDVAGSGGYYVACGSDTIFANATTVTASIGVVGGKLATTGLWNKVGIRWKSYSRGANSGILSSSDLFSESERETVRALMVEVYDTFKSHVVAIRGDRLKQEIDELAGGRVFTGQQALELGLIDKIGGLADAIDHVAGQAKISDYNVRVLPRPKSFVEVLLGDAGGADDDPSTISTSLTLLWPKRFELLLEAALPYLKGLEPDRMEAVGTALNHLSLLSDERVLLAMPEIRLAD